MSEQSYTREQMITIQPCPKCTKPHEYRFQIRFQTRLLLFGGRDSVKTSQVPAERVAAQLWRCPLTCPETKKAFIHLVEVPPKRDETVIAVTLITQAVVAAPSPATSSVGLGAEMIQAEALEWLKASAANAREFCKTMLTMTTAAIPLFFTVLQFMGTKGLPKVVPTWVSIGPPVFFLLGAAVFVFALLPHAGFAATEQEFIRFRNSRIQQMKWLIWLGVGFFGGGTAISIYIFLRLLPG